MPRDLTQFLYRPQASRMIMTKVIQVHLADRLVNLSVRGNTGGGEVVAPLPSDLSGMVAGDTVWCLNTGTYLFPMTFNRPGTLVTLDDQLDELRAEVADLRARLARLEP